MHSIKLLKAQGSYSATKVGQKQGNCLCHQGLCYLPSEMAKIIKNAALQLVFRV